MEPFTQIALDRLRRFVRTTTWQDFDRKCGNHLNSAFIGYGRYCHGPGFWRLEAFQSYRSVNGVRNGNSGCSIEKFCFLPFIFPEIFSKTRISPINLSLFVHSPMDHSFSWFSPKKQENIEMVNLSEDIYLKMFSKYF